MRYLEALPYWTTLRANLLTAGLSNAQIAALALAEIRTRAGGDSTLSPALLLNLQRHAVIQKQIQEQQADRDWFVARMQGTAGDALRGRFPQVEFSATALGDKAALVIWPYGKPVPLPEGGV